MKQLPVFNGYIVDWRLRQFLRGDEATGIEFIPFESAKGQEIFSQMPIQVFTALEEVANWEKLRGEQSEATWQKMAHLAKRANRKLDKALKRYSRLTKR